MTMDIIESFINAQLNNIKTNLQSLTKQNHLEELLNDIQKKLSNNNVYRLINIINQLPHVSKNAWEIENGKLVIQTDESNLEQIKSVCLQLKPWRKGPYKINSIDIDTEWKSYLKWNRIHKHINLNNKTILDIGCGSGYFLYLMKYFGAKHIVGVDPMELFLFQFLVSNHFCKEKSICFVPAKWQQFNHFDHAFDIIFCMGVLYHQKEPETLLNMTFKNLKKTGQIILETLIVPDSFHPYLMPKSRYANMRNVYFLPTISETENWLSDAGYKDIKCIDISTTTEEEQRKTVWSEGYSLTESLDPLDPNLTIEGHPRPRRALFIAKK